MTWADGITYGGAVWEVVAGKAASGLFEVAQMAVADVNESGGLAKGKTEPVASIFEGIAHFGGKLTPDAMYVSFPAAVGFLEVLSAVIATDARADR